MDWLPCIGVGLELWRSAFALFQRSEDLYEKLFSIRERIAYTSVAIPTAVKCSTENPPISARFESFRTLFKERRKSQSSAKAPVGFKEVDRCVAGLLGASHAKPETTMTGLSYEL